MALKCDSTFGNFFGSFFLKKEQYPPAQRPFTHYPRQREENEGKKRQSHTVAKHSGKKKSKY
jgi:hypothetical protein